MIFDDLIENKIPFAVVVSIMKAPVLEYHTNEYHIIIRIKDRRKLYQRGFRKGRFHVLEKQLTDDEIGHFKQINNKFSKVCHTKHGRVYELKTLPFKDYEKHQL